MLRSIAMLAAIAGADTSTMPKTAADAIAIADAHPGRAMTGVFRVTIAAGSRTLNNVFLNTSVDYRSPDDVTIDLRPITAKALAKRLGARPEVALVGRTITVRGTVRAVPIANTPGERPSSLKTYQHTIFVQDENQITVE